MTCARGYCLSKLNTSFCATVIRDFAISTGYYWQNVKLTFFSWFSSFYAKSHKWLLEGMKVWWWWCFQEKNENKVALFFKFGLNRRWSGRSTGHNKSLWTKIYVCRNLVSLRADFSWEKLKKKWVSPVSPWQCFIPREESESAMAPESSEILKTEWVTLCVCFQPSSWNNWRNLLSLFSQILHKVKNDRLQLEKLQSISKKSTFSLNKGRQPGPHLWVSTRCYRKLISLLNNFCNVFESVR